MAEGLTAREQAAELWLTTAENQGFWFNCSASGEIWQHEPIEGDDLREKMRAAWNSLAPEFELNRNAIYAAIRRRREKERGPLMEVRQPVASCPEKPGN